MRPELISALLGGALIGLAASLILVFNGRVMGISGILSRALSTNEGPNAWRWAALAGLFGGGIFLRTFLPSSLTSTIHSSSWMTALAGVLVGIGSVLGNGCTSGHGVCGISRMSFRSLIATMIFIMAGAFTVVLLRNVGGRL